MELRKGTFMANDELRQERSELRDVKLAHFEQCELRIATQKAEVSELAKLMKGSVTDIWQAVEEIRHLAKEDGIRLTKHKELFGYREGHDEVKQAHVHAVVGAREVLMAAKFIEQVARHKITGARISGTCRHYCERGNRRPAYDLSGVR